MEINVAYINIIMYLHIIPLSISRIPDNELRDLITRRY